jgi:hypothetical protein
VLGRSVVDRTLDRFLRVGVDSVSVLVQGTTVEPHILSGGTAKVEWELSTDLRAGITAKLADFAFRGIQHSFVISANTYTETDLLDFFYFHRESHRSITRAFDRGGPLQFWVADCAKAARLALPTALAKSDSSGRSYFIREYVSRINTPEDLHSFVSDSLRGRCGARPCGHEIRPGIWIDEGAEINRHARLVAPVYVGKNSKVCDDALITRCTNIEENCLVDVGTVVEDSSILKNTRVGIWLDLSHSIAEGNKLINLRHNAVVEISDPSVLCSTLARPAVAAPESIVVEPARTLMSEPLQQTLPSQKAWQLGANLIQG